MSHQETLVVDQRLLDSGEEAGTAPDDRRFRPDVEGLRAVAVLLVVLYHAGLPHLAGGYVGVDVFFVISGFVITGLLLRERKGTGRTSLLAFYARRCRRILPAATLVILITVVFGYVLLGAVTGNKTADDGRWAALFLSNFHFEWLNTNYLTASHPPSPLQNFWTLSVEEQFYVVYPTLFLLVAGSRSLRSIRVRMAIALCIVIVASYWLSITQTATHSTSAYFSPFTRAWELALGALVAMGTSWLKKVPAQFAAVVTWAGLAAIIFAAVTFNPLTAYPGSVVAIPVVGAALIIAGGVAMPRTGVESLLGLHPFRWLGRRSYSLYLWHWPILIIAAERVGKTSLPISTNLLLVLAALVVSAATYRFVENPIRHWQLSSKKSVTAGAGLVAISVIALSLIIITESASPPIPIPVPASNSQVVLNEVAVATRITSVPKSISLSQADTDTVWNTHVLGGLCQSFIPQSYTRICVVGDPRGKDLMVVYGDSHAQMWVPALVRIARQAHWRLVVLSKLWCPAGLLTVANPPDWNRPDGAYTICNKWHQWVVQWINTHTPNILIVSQRDPSLYHPPSPRGAPPLTFSAAQWQRGLGALLDAVKVPHMAKVVLGNIPLMPEYVPACLSAHPHDVQACSSSAAKAVSPYNEVEQAAARDSGADYIDTTPWFCSSTCTPIIGRYVAYQDNSHITATYARYLYRVLGHALGFR